PMTEPRTWSEQRSASAADGVRDGGATLGAVAPRRGGRAVRARPGSRSSRSRGHAAKLTTGAALRTVSHARRSLQGCARVALLRLFRRALGDLRYRFFGALVVLPLEHDVGLRDDSNQQAALVDDGDASDLFTAHEVHDVVHRVACGARTDLGGHDVADGCGN